MNFIRVHRLGISSKLLTISATERSIARIPHVKLLHVSKHCQSLNDQNLSSGEVEIYNGPLSSRIRGVKLFSLVTSITGIFAQPVILNRAAELEASTTAIVATCGFVGFFTFVTPLLLHIVTKKYVTSVSYNKTSDTYTATIITLFLRKRKIRFKPGEAELPEVGGLTSAKVRGIPLFMDASFFSDIDHYKRIMGYDKPMDFKLGPKKELT